MIAHQLGIYDRVTMRLLYLRACDLDVHNIIRIGTSSLDRDSEVVAVLISDFNVSP